VHCVGRRHCIGQGFASAIGDLDLPPEYRKQGCLPHLSRDTAVVVAAVVVVVVVVVVAGSNWARIAHYFVAVAVAVAAA